jgi:hypothetical protein
LVENGGGAQRSRETVMMFRHLCDLVIPSADLALKGILSL